MSFFWCWMWAKRVDSTVFFGARGQERWFASRDLEAASAGDNVLRFLAGGDGGAVLLLMITCPAMLTIVSRGGETVAG